MRKSLLFLVVVCLIAAPLSAASRNERAHNDAVRLAALLHDVQPNVTVSAAMWRTIANEANVLANRMFANTRGATRQAARDARMHVREMRASALKGDAAAARRHASEALPFVTKVIVATAGK